MLQNNLRQSHLPDLCVSRTKPVAQTEKNDAMMKGCFAKMTANLVWRAFLEACADFRCNSCRSLEQAPQACLNSVPAGNGWGMNFFVQATERSEGYQDSAVNPAAQMRAIEGGFGGP